MRRCGEKRVWHKPDAYTDVHEDKETKAFRKEYLETNAELQLRERTWVQMDEGRLREVQSGVHRGDQGARRGRS